MKRILLLLFLAFFSFGATGQRIRITDTTNTWKVYCSGGGTEWYSLVYDYAFKGDTAMNGSIYKKLVGTSRLLAQMPGVIVYPPKPGTFYLREDTLARKVWCRGSNLDYKDTAEYLIYSAAWALGDTIRTNKSPSNKTYITGVDSTQMAGQWYRVFKINASTMAPSQVYFDIVEGLGATLGPGFAFTGGSGGEYNINLRCFYNGVTKPVLNPALSNLFWNGNGTFSNAGPCNLAVNDPLNGGSAFLSPNPANSRSKIVLPHSIQQGRLAIYNGSGQMISNTAIGNTATVPLPADISIPGLYFYRITDQKDGQSFTGRFAYE